MLNLELVEKFAQIMNITGQDGGFNFDSLGEYPDVLPESEELVFFYNKCNPKSGTFVKVGSSAVFFKDVNSLVNIQNGYFPLQENHNDKHSSKSLVVFALKDDDPIYANTQVFGTEILCAYETCDPFVISNTFEEFICALIELLYIQHVLFEDEIMDDDFIFLDSFLNTVTEKLSQINGINVEGFIDFFFG